MWRAHPHAGATCSRAPHAGACPAAGAPVPLAAALPDAALGCGAREMDAVGAAVAAPAGGGRGVAGSASALPAAVARGRAGGRWHVCRGGWRAKAARGGWLVLVGAPMS
eukprot:356673-Chlamydomonas_euryale.AAC.3